MPYSRQQKARKSSVKKPSAYNADCLSASMDVNGHSNVCSSSQTENERALNSKIANRTRRRRVNRDNGLVVNEEVSFVMSASDSIKGEVVTEKVDSSDRNDKIARTRIKTAALIEKCRVQRDRIGSAITSHVCLVGSNGRKGTL